MEKRVDGSILVGIGVNSDGSRKVRGCVVFVILREENVLERRE